MSPIDRLMAKMERRARDLKLEVDFALSDIPVLTEEVRRLRALLQECATEGQLAKGLADRVLAELRGEA